MSEFIRKAIEKSLLLKKKRHLAPKTTPVADPVNWDEARSKLREILRANGGKPGPWLDDNGQLRLLTRRLLGMRHEFKSYDKTGEEERRDFLRAGIVGAGLTAAGGLAGLGLYKAGVSAAARNAAQLGGELNRARKSLKGIRDWKLAKATTAKATAATQKSAYEKAASKFYADGGAFDKHVNAVSRAQAAKAKAAAKATRDAAKAAKTQAAQAATAAKATQDNTSTIPEGIFKPNSTAPLKSDVAADKVEAAAKAAAPVPPTPRVYKSWSQAKGAFNRGEITQGQLDQITADFQSPKAPAPTPKTPKTPKATGGRKKNAQVESSGDTPRRNNISDLMRQHGLSRLIPFGALREFGTKMLSKFQLAKIKARRDQRLLDAAAGIKRNRKGWIRPAKFEATVDKFGNPLKQKRKWTRAISTTGGLDALVQNASESGGLEGLLKKLSRRDVARMRYFNQLQAEEGGIPLTGRVARDRFVKKIRDEDLDRRDANILRAGGAGALAGLMARGRIGAGKRALIGAGAGGLGVIGIRSLTNNDRDIYGERNRGSKRAELIPALGGLGAAAWLAAKRFKALAAKINGGVKNFDDYRLYYFKGRNTGIAARSAEEARSKKKRGGDELVAVRTPNATEKSQMARGIWVRTRRDGKSPQKSRYGKGRGQGPARKSLSAKLRLREFGEFGKAWTRGWDWFLRNRTAIGLTAAGTGASVAASRYYGPSNKGWKKLNEEQKQLAAKFFEKRDRREKRELNPYVGAALSGGASGASLGALSLLKRGTSVASAGATAAKLGALSAGIVGGGALIGSRIVGDPRKEEGAPFTKRAALGGAITGALVGGAGGLLLRNTKFMKDAAKTWRPAKWMTEAPALGAGALGALGGAVIGGAQGADEGQQVDSIRNIRKDIKQKNFSRLMEFRALPAVAVKQVWKTDPALRADFAKRVIAKVRSAVTANKKQYGMKEFQVSPLNVEPMAKTKERRASERANFLKGIGAAAAVGLAGLGGYHAARVISRAEINAAKLAKRAATIDAEVASGQAKRYQRQAEEYRNRAADAERRYYRDNSSSYGSGASSSGSAKASSGSSSGFSWEDFFNTGGTGGRSKSYDDDYVRRSQEARQRSRSSGSGSNSGASGGSKKGAQGVKNPYAGTDKAEAWEKWQSMDRMAKESPHDGERVAAAIARDKWKKRYNLARKLRGLKMFGRDDQPRYRDSKAWADPIMGWIRGDDLVDKDGNKWSPSSPQLVNAMHNKARGIRVNVQRGAGLAGDTTAVLQGKDRERDASGRVKKREWEKAWFRNAMTTAGLTVAGLAGAGVWRYGRMNPGTALGKFVTNTEQGVRKTKSDIKSGLGRVMGAADDVTGPKKFSAKLRQLREFDLFASAAGWDTRDPRGRSVRVYAPGSKTRVRREKYWHEKAENQRKLMIAAGVGAAAIGGLGGVAAYRLAKGKSLVPSFMLKKPQAAAVASKRLSPEEMKANTDAMSRMAKEQAAQRDAERAAAWKKKQAEATRLNKQKIPNPNWHHGDAA